jgi:hypothetical protein
MRKKHQEACEVTHPIRDMRSTIAVQRPAPGVRETVRAGKIAQASTDRSKIEKMTAGAQHSLVCILVIVLLPETRFLAAVLPPGRPHTFKQKATKRCGSDQGPLRVKHGRTFTPCRRSIYDTGSVYCSAITGAVEPAATTDSIDLEAVTGLKNGPP